MPPVSWGEVGLVVVVVVGVGGGERDIVAGEGGVAAVVVAEGEWAVW